MEIKELLRLQETLDREIMNRFYKNGGDMTDKELLNDRILASFVEAGEFANALGSFKYWKENHNTDADHTLEEFIDILFFWLSIANLLGFKEEDIKQMYLKKYLENQRRVKEGY